jgi:hypothetical protein
MDLGCWPRRVELQSVGQRINRDGERREIRAIGGVKTWAIAVLLSVCGEKDLKTKE